MARRRPVEAMPAAAVDEWEVRYQAARRAALMAGVVSVPRDDPWWTRWHESRHGVDPLDFERLALRYEQAVERLDAGVLYEHHLPIVRRFLAQRPHRHFPQHTHTQEEIHD